MEQAFIQIGGTPGRGRSGQARTAGAEGLPIQSSTTSARRLLAPIYKAGLDAGDVILKADGKDIKDAQAFNDNSPEKMHGQDHLQLSNTHRRP